MANDEGACIICLDTTPPPIQSGCACRGDTGLAHIDCRVQVAASQQPQIGQLVSENQIKTWSVCQTCKHEFTGAMRTGLAEAWRSLAAGTAAPLHAQRDVAELNFAKALNSSGNYAEAEPLLRNLHAELMRMFGAENSLTLRIADELAKSLAGLGKLADAERIQREVLEAQRRVLGADSMSALATAGSLAGTLVTVGKHAEAEAILREMLRVHKRVCGAEHHDTLHNEILAQLACSLSGQCKHAEAEAIRREVLGVQKRVLGAEHPSTLTSANNLASTLCNQGKNAEAESMLHATLASCQRLLGPAHPITLGTAASLEIVRSSIANTRAISLNSQGRFDEAEQLLRATLASCQQVLGPTHYATLSITGNLARAREFITLGVHRNAGFRVIVQRHITKPELNGKLARVVSFDARSRRYTVVLDDGNEVSLKAECVDSAGCAAAGCPSEEASSVCGRCQEVRYCSRKCQRAHWKAHKLECVLEKPDPI
jgi:tetratricopeptide (TPR) repeat protein